MVRADEGPSTGGAVLLDDDLLRRIERLSLRTRRSGARVGNRPGARRTPAADFIDHRPYSPGDDRRHIDWPAVARHDEVFVKVGRVTHAADVYIVLDISRSMAELPGKHRMSLELAAALGWMSLAAGDRTTVVPFPAIGASASWGPASGTGRGADLLAHLSQLATVSASASHLESVVSDVAARAPAGGLLVVVSDLWVADDFDVALARVPSPRWDVLVLHVLDTDELEPTVSGALEVVDCETDEAVTLVVDDAAIAEYRVELNRRLDRLRSLVGARGASYALLPSDWPLERAVIPYLQRRALLVG
ncbi:MAG: DUF58 domain-containing protein [Anaerolineae bacterium]